MTNDDPDAPGPLDPDAKSRGILTKKDRRFLLDQDDSGPQERSDRRYRIRERVKNGFYDFPFLNMFLSDEDRENIFGDLTAGNRAIANQISSALGFIYAGLNDIDQDLESTLARAIDTVEQRQSPDELVRVEVNIEIEREQPSVDEVIDRFINEEGTIDDFNYILRHENEGAATRLFERLEEEDQDLQLIEPKSGNTPQIPLDVFQELIESVQDEMQDNLDE